MPPSRNKSIEEQIQTLMDAVPASGEIEYTSLYDNVVATGNKDALNHLFPLKRQGKLNVRVEHNEDTHEVKSFVSRA